MSESFPTKPDLLPEIRHLVGAVRGRATVLMRIEHVDYLLSEIDQLRLRLRHIREVAGADLEVDVDALRGDLP